MAFKNIHEQAANDTENLVYVGTVVDNDDPTHLEKIKVTIPGLFEGAAEVLPWCAPKKIRIVGAGSGYSSIGIPRIGSHVFVELLHGEEHCPVYTGALMLAGQIPSEFVTNYPNRYGLKDPAGNLIYVDLTPGSQTMHLGHKSGTVIDVSDSGNVTVHSVGTTTVNSDGDLVIHSNGTANINSVGDATLQSSGQVNIAATGQITWAGSSVTMSGVTGNVEMGSIGGVLHLP